MLQPLIEKVRTGLAAKQPLPEAYFKSITKNLAQLCKYLIKKINESTKRMLLKLSNGALTCHAKS